MSEQYLTKEHFDQAIEKIGDKFGKIDENFDEIARMVKEGFDSVGNEIKNIKTEITAVKSLMVTKDYLDDKLAELEGSTIVRQRKQDKKMNLMAELLKEKKIFGDDDLKRLQDIQVFPASPAI